MLPSAPELDEILLVELEVATLLDEVSVLDRDASEVVEIALVDAVSVEDRDVVEILADDV